MKESEMKELWKSQDHKLNTLIQINRTLLEEVTNSKAKKAVLSTRTTKYIGIILGIIWVIILDGLAFVGWHSGNYVFFISVLVISLLTKFAIGTYIYHLVLINEIDHSDTVIKVQQRLAKLKSSTVLSTRIMVLQLPFWTTWYLNIDLLKSEFLTYGLVNFIVLLSFCYAAYWLFTHIKMEYIDRKWMKWFFADGQWNQLIYADQLLNQISEYQDITATDS